MSWVIVGVAAAGAVKGMMDADANKQKAKSHDRYRKQAITHSPWTGMGDPGPAQVGNTNAFSGALGGAMQGAMVGSMFGGGGGGAAAGGGGGAAAGGGQPMAMNTNMQKNPWMIS